MTTNLLGGVPKDDVPATPAREFSRIQEKVIINVASNVSTAIVLAFLAGAVSGIGWLLQRIFGFAVVPSHLLAAMAFVGAALLLLVGLAYVVLRVLAHAFPFTFSFALLGIVLGMLADVNAQKQKAHLSSKRAEDTPNTPPANSEPRAPAFLRSNKRA